METIVGLAATAMRPIEESEVVQIVRVLGDPVSFSIYKHIVEMNELRCGDAVLLFSPRFLETVLSRRQ
jgi:hypothetical protein